MICVECGAQVEGLVGGSCPACFAKKNRLLQVPDVLDVEVCAHCDARHVGAHWIDPADGAPLSWVREDAVRAAARVHHRIEGAVLDVSETAEDEKHFRTTVALEGEVEGVEVTDEATLTVRVKRGVCDRCSRMFGGFYAAVLQLRATDRDVAPHELKVAHRVVREELERARVSGNRAAFLAKDQPEHGGHDYYVGDIEAGRQVARALRERLGAAVQESAKLVGRKEGEDVFRVTFLVRIRRFATGDYAESDGRVVQVQSTDRGNAIVVDLASHKRTRVPEEGLRRLGGAEVVREAVLVSQDPRNLQVMDPVSYRTHDIPRPEGYSADGETVAVLRHEERLYLAPAGTRALNNL